MHDKDGSITHKGHSQKRRKRRVGPNDPGFGVSNMGKGDSQSDSYVSRVVKYLLFTFNFLFWIIGVGLIGIGSWAYIETNRFSHNEVKSIFDLLFNVTIIIIVVGCVIFVIAFFGCLGALRENTILLKIFAGIIAMIFIVEVIGAVLAFIFSDQIKNKVTDVLKDEAIVRYREDANLHDLINWFQENFACCGVSDKGFRDWSNNPYFNCTTGNPSPEKCAVPYSCCIQEKKGDENYINTMCGYNTQELSYIDAKKKIYVTGCVEAVLKKAEDNLYIVGGVALGVAVIQLLGIFLSLVLARQIQDQQDRYV